VRVAFYAPMKAPDHPVPSGDRAVARLLLTALAHGGHEVELASHLRSWQARPDAARQERLVALGDRLCQRLLRRYRRRPPERRPQAWITYHLYYKAPDLLGPAVARGLAIPYLPIEVSLAYKRAGGPWDAGHRAVLAAVEAAQTVVQINPEDADCLPATARQVPLPAFLDAAPFRAARGRKAALREGLRACADLDTGVAWLVAVGMMRSGDKAASYAELAQALGGLNDLPWQLLLVGDGPARAAVEAAFRAALGPDDGRTRFLGQLEESAVADVLAAADLYLWPAVNEAYGMALLEAQASGLPVVAGRRPGVAAIVGEDESGILTPMHDTAAFAAAVRRLLEDAGQRRRLAAGAAARIDARHDIAAAAARLSALLEAAVGRVGA